MSISQMSIGQMFFYQMSIGQMSIGQMVFYQTTPRRQRRKKSLITFTTGDEKMDASRKSSAGHEVATQVRRHRQDHLLRQRLQAEGDLHSGDEPIKLYSCFYTDAQDPNL